MSDAVLRLEKIRDLLEIEREEDLRLYKELFLRVGIDQRRKNGVTWFPVKMLNEELGSGELVHLDVERTSYLDHAHQFSSGKNVAIFGPEEQEINGTVKSIAGNTMKIVVHSDELPDWCYDGRIGVNIQFDDYSYEAMFEALAGVINAKGRTRELREIIEGNIQPEFEREDESIQVSGLNASQNMAVRKVISARDIAVIHGPPGTGKTTSLVQAIRLTLQREKQVLVCAPTNTAVDLLTEKMKEAGIDVLRLGHPARISDDLVSTSLDGRLTASSYYKDIRQLRRTAEEYFRMAGKYKRVFGKEEAQQRAAYYAEARNCIKEARLLEDFVVDELFANAQAICCTPVTARHKGLQGKRFKTLFFDEASQALEPMVWLPLLKCQRVVLAGDHFQLPPVVKSKEAKQGGLDKTMLDRCIEYKDAVVLLNRQYRMNNSIMEFSNRWFYEGKLHSDETVKEHVLFVGDEGPEPVIEFIDTAGCGFDELQNPETLSYSNPGEGRILFSHLEDLLKLQQLHGRGEDIDIGIVSPYKEQREWLSENIDPSFAKAPGVASLQIRTIDGFQGEERDVIYISLVRSNEHQEIGFLNDIRRMNVAITRARKKLVVIGDSSTIGQSSFYKTFLEYCEQHGRYRSAWEWNS